MPPTVDELKAQLEAAEVAEKEAEAVTVSRPVLQQVKEAGETGTPFIEKLRIVAAKMGEAGQIIEQDIVTAAEQGPVFATLIKLVGELVA